MKLQKTLTLSAVLITAAIASEAQWFHLTRHNWAVHPAPYASELAHDTVLREDGLIDVIFHVTPPRSSKNIAVAAYSSKEQGAPSGTDDIGVMATGEPLVEIQKDGVRVGVLLPLFDRSLHTIGTLGLMYRYRAGDDQNNVLRRSEKIRNALALRINSQADLFDITK